MENSKNIVKSVVYYLPVDFYYWEKLAEIRVWGVGDCGE